MYIHHIYVYVYIYIYIYMYIYLIYIYICIYNVCKYILTYFQPFSLCMLCLYLKICFFKQIFYNFCFRSIVTTGALQQNENGKKAK